MMSLIPTAYAANTDCSPGTGDEPTNLLKCFPLANGDQALEVYSTPAMMVNLIVNLMFLGAGLLIFVWILYAAFKMISGKKKGFDEAKTMMTNAIIGLIVMILAYWIVQLVGYITGMNLSITVPRG